MGSVQKCSLKKDNLSWEEVLTTLISFLESTILYLWKWSVGSLFRTHSMCTDDDLSLSFSSILDEDLLHLALLCGLVQYSFDKGRAWWLATTQPNRGEVQLYHGVFAKYVTDRYYGISYGLVCSGKVQQRALYRCEWSSADGDANAPQQLSSHPGGPAVTSLNILWLAKFWKGHWQTSVNICEWKTLSSSRSPY